MGEFMLGLEFINKAVGNALENERCHELHEGGCNVKALKQFANGCRSMYKMYLLVHLIPLLTFKRKRLAKNPTHELRKLIVGFVKSLLFAGGYSMLVRRGICFFTQTVRYSAFCGYLAGTAAGVTLLFEPVSRQAEIALYTLNKSMEVVYNMGLRRECLLNAVAIAVLSLVYINSPEVFKDSYRRVIDLLLKDC